MFEFAVGTDGYNFLIFTVSLFHLV